MVQEGLSYLDQTLLDPENKNTYLYNGKEQDAQTKFFEYGFRDYDAQIGRWHVRDALAESTFSVSPYAYANNNPVKNIDVAGLMFVPVEQGPEISSGFGADHERMLGESRGAGHDILGNCGGGGDGGSGGGGGGGKSYTITKDGFFDSNGNEVEWSVVWMWLVTTDQIAESIINMSNEGWLYVNYETGVIGKIEVFTDESEAYKFMYEKSNETNMQFGKWVDFIEVSGMITTNAIYVFPTKGNTRRTSNNNPVGIEYRGYKRESYDGDLVLYRTFLLFAGGDKEQLLAQIHTHPDESSHSPGDLLLSKTYKVPVFTLGPNDIRVGWDFSGVNQRRDKNIGDIIYTKSDILNGSSLRDYAKYIIENRIGNGIH